MNSVLNALFDPSERVVLVDSRYTFTARTLLGRVNRCRGSLADGVNPGDRVALIGTSSASFFVWVYAVWCEGATVIPIDVSYPSERIEAIAQHADARIAASIIPDGPVRDGDFHRWEEDEIATILFSSGTTGIPKGILLPVRACLADEIVMQVPHGNSIFWSSISHSHLFYHLVTIVKGHTVVCVTKEEWTDNEHMRALVARWSVRQVFMTPSYATAILAMSRPWVLSDSLHITLFGETAPDSLVRRLEADDLYGQTEVASLWLAKRRGNEWIPEPQAQLDILDSGDCPVRSVMETGRLVVNGSAHLATGYLDGNSILPPHDTGDLAEWTSLDPPRFRLIGRSDRMIKVRGFRVELDEIERCLTEAPEVSDARVRANPERIEAFVCPSNLSVPSIRTYLEQRLPSYMIPSIIVPLDSFETTAIGKAVAPQIFAAPGNAAEEEMCAIWQEVLQVESVGIHDSFFDLGGHSLLVIRVLARYPDLTPSDFERNPTVAHLSAIERKTQLDPNQYPFECDFPVRLRFLEINFFPRWIIALRLWYLRQFSRTELLRDYHTLRFTECYPPSAKVDSTLGKLFEIHPLLRARFTSKARLRITATRDSDTVVHYDQSLEQIDQLIWLDPRKLVHCE